MDLYRRRRASGVHRHRAEQVSPYLAFKGIYVEGFSRNTLGHISLYLSMDGPSSVSAAERRWPGGWRAPRSMALSGGEMHGDSRVAGP